MKKCILLISSVILLWSCSNSASENEETAPDEIAELNDDVSADTSDTAQTDSIPEGTIQTAPFAIEGMLLVEGTDKAALESETPQMKVVLNYDY